MSSESDASNSEIAPSSGKWYYDVGLMIEGPVELSELELHASRTVLKPDHRVRRAEQESFSRADSFPEIRRFFTAPIVESSTINSRVPREPHDGVPITTTEGFLNPGFVLKRHYNIITARRLIPCGICPSQSGLADFEARIREAERELLQELRKQAFQLGARAVVGMRSSINEIDVGGADRGILLTVHGTPVSIERCPPVEGTI